jgi:peptidoglycan/LPS O-acetylase OafA/YrhL
MEEPMTIYASTDPKRDVSKKIPAYSAHLDLIRGLAALTVMVGHLKFFLGSMGRTATGNGGFAPPLADNANPMNPAHEAVIVFFLLSGVLVGGSVLRDLGAKRFLWDSYLVRRLSRLLTVLVPALLIGFILDSTTKYLLLQHAAFAHTQLGSLSRVHLDAKTFFGNLFFLQTLDRTRIPSLGTNAALWSLAYEWWYYLLFPFIAGVLVLGARRRQIAYSFIAILLMYWLWRDPLSRFPVWVLGALATRLPVFIPERWQRVTVAILALQFIACAGLLWVRPLPSFLMNDLILSVSFAALVVAILHRRSTCGKGVYARVAQLVAKPSYSVYLFHLPIMSLIGTCAVLYQPVFLRHKLPAMALIASINYGLCYLLYGAFEAHTEKVRKIAASWLGVGRELVVPVMSGAGAVKGSMPTVKAAAR